MKTFNTLALTMLLTSMSVVAQEAAETTREINAQTTVTRGQIDNIIERVNSTKTDSRFNATDYWAQNQDFKNSVDQTMKTFEETLEKGIFPKAAYWMDQYNSIQISNEFSPNQKEILLKQRLENIKNQFALLSKEYQAALKKVYSLIPSASSQSVKFEVLTPSDTAYIGGDFTRQVKVKLSIANSRSYNTSVTVTFVGQDGTYKDIQLIYLDTKVVYNINDYRYGSVPGIFNTTNKNGSAVTLDYQKLITFDKLENLKKKVFQEAIYPTFKGSCVSTICLGLRASDQASLLTLVKTNLDRNIKLKLADGNVLTLVGLNLPIEKTLSLLSRVDYPVNLPFDL
jgi:hypothetical protein